MPSRSARRCTIPSHPPALCPRQCGARRRRRSCRAMPRRQTAPSKSAARSTISSRKEPADRGLPPRRRRDDEARRHRQDELVVPGQHPRPARRRVTRKLQSLGEILAAVPAQELLLPELAPRLSVLLRAHRAQSLGRSGLHAALLALRRSGAGVAAVRLPSRRRRVRQDARK